MNVNSKLITIAVASLFVTACSVAPTKSSAELERDKNARMNAAMAKVQSDAKKTVTSSVREIDDTAPSFTRTKYKRIKGDVNLSAAATPFGPLLTELARKEKYSVAFDNTVDINKKISINYIDATSDDAIRTSAFLAGYVAVIDKNLKTVMVSDVATYNFKVPSSVFSSLQAQYSVGGNPANSGGSGGGSGGSSSGGSSSGSSGTSLRASFIITGKEGTNADGLTKFLQGIAGKNSEVIIAESGHISVRANAQALRRVHDFLKTYAKEAMTQVEIEATVLEVSLKNEFSFGIDWSKVISGSLATGLTAISAGSASGALAGTLTTGSLASAVTSAASTMNGQSFSITRVDADQVAIIKALAGFTDVSVMSQPKLVSLNNVPASFFDGNQLPYVGSVTQTALSSQATSPTVTGDVSFAIDGVSFSAVPSVMSDTSVQITMLPVLSSVSGFSSFLNNTLTAPNQANKQSFMRVIAESGKTLILGGIRNTNDNKTTENVVNQTRKSGSKEVVILLRANIVPAPDYDPIVGESL